MDKKSKTFVEFETVEIPRRSSSNGEFAARFVENSQDLGVVIRKITSNHIIDPEEYDRFEFELRNYHLKDPFKIAKSLNSSIATGLTREFAQERLQKLGQNIVKPAKQLPLWAKFLLCFVTGFAPLLWTASGLSFISWEPFGTPPTNLYNLILAVVLIIVIVISGSFVFYQEIQANMIMKGFQNLVPSMCLVTRGGTQLLIQAADLVIGDIVTLSTGQKVPSDIRIITSSGLKIDKSMLTGESIPMKVTEGVMEESVSYLEATNVVFMGCNIVEGEGIGIVIAAGNQNQLSKIIEHTTQSEGKTSLQAEIDRLVAIIAIFALTTTIIVVLYWVFYLRIAHSSFMNLSSMISNVIGITVSYVPEGLPVAMTLGLTIIARRLCLKYFVLVKRLGSIETLGSISFLASDKTGTLTQNKMAVTGIISSTRIEEVAEKDSDIDFMTSNFIKESSERICALCNQSVLESQTPDKQAIASVEDGSGTFCLAVGSNATDRALLNWANSNNTAQNILNDYKQLVLLPFSSATKLTAVVAQKKKTGERFVFIKGAPEYIFPLCSTYIDSRDQVVPKNGEFVSKILNLVEDDGLKGKRIISLAQLGPLSFDQYPNDYEFTTDPKPNFPMDNFTFVSCVCVSDPPREGVKEAIKELRTAGIKVAMVTGDAPNTAVAIARAVGIVSHNEAIDKMTNLGNFKPNVGINILTETEEFSDNKGLESIVVTGRELENIEQEGWDFIFSHNELVFSRTTPDQKLQIVKESQRRGHLVGVTGDGVNDSPALKKANIGIAMNSGSDVAKDVAAIVLLRDDFTAIPKGVREGRLIFENLRKVVGYQISAGSWGEVLPVLATFFLGLPQPLSSFLMIMVCCFSDVYAGIAIMMEPPENAIMLKPPRDLKKSRLLDLKLVFYSYLFYANLISIGSFYNYFIYMASRGNTRAVPDPVPSDDNGNLQFPAGYRSGQLLFAWNWGSDSGNLGADETAAAKVGSSVFYITIVCGQMGHLLSIRRKTPYFYDAIMATQPGSENKNIFVRIWEEISTSEIRFPVLAAWTGAVCTTFILNDIKFFQDDCGTGVVPGRFWGMAIGWSILWFIIAEIRKWLIFLFPESIIAKTAW